MSEEVLGRNLKIVTPVWAEAKSRPWLLVHAIRTAFLVCILLVSVIYQVHIGNFLNVEIWLPVYGVLVANFFLNSVYLFFFDKFGANQQTANGVLFGLDVSAITLLIYFTGTSQSLFMFLYLVNLILAGLVFSKEGTWLLALWTSICFSGLLIFSTDISGQSLYFSLVVNNVAFVAVTFLGNRLTEQLDLVGTQLEVTQSDLVALQNLNDLIVNNIRAGVIVISRTGFIQFANSNASEILHAGLPHQAKLSDIWPELGWPWESFVTDESAPDERRGIQVEREGKAYQLEVVAARFRDMDQRIKGWLLVVDDRTELKQIEEAMRQQEKLAAVGQLAAGIAHEIRNPLASISGSVQMMIANPDDHSEENLKLMNIVNREIDRLNGLITEFLDYVRPEPKSFIPINLNPIVQEVLESLKFNSQIKQDVQVSIELNAKCDILGSRDKLRQAFLNLFLNAYQAMEKTIDAHLRVKTADESKKVVLTIEDSGVGIKPENLTRIFEPFHTTKPRGTGLGLAVTHKILQAHDAKVLVESQVGEGTQFRIEFPAHFHFHTEDLIDLKTKANG